jgi:hypothetical protein
MGGRDGARQPRRHGWWATSWGGAAHPDCIHVIDDGSGGVRGEGVFPLFDFGLVLHLRELLPRWLW